MQSKISSIYVILAAMLLSGCAAVTEEPPGVGAKANQGYAACNFIITVLEEYNTANGEYPESLQELVPDYSPSIPDRVNNEPIVYTRTETGYTLRFSYVGPGMNICTYSTDAGREWRCTGAH
jgi:hypothetical protein